MAAVYQARDVTIQRLVATKMLNPAPPPGLERAGRATLPAGSPNRCATAPHQHRDHLRCWRAVGRVFHHHGTSGQQSAGRHLKPRPPVLGTLAAHPAPGSSRPGLRPPAGPRASQHEACQRVRHARRPSETAGLRHCQGNGDERTDRLWGHCGVACLHGARVGSRGTCRPCRGHLRPGGAGLRDAHRALPPYVCHNPGPPRARVRDAAPRGQVEFPPARGRETGPRASDGQAPTTAIALCSDVCESAGESHEGSRSAVAATAKPGTRTVPLDGGRHQPGSPGDPVRNRRAGDSSFLSVLFPITDVDPTQSGHYYDLISWSKAGPEETKAVSVPVTPSESYLSLSRVTKQNF